MFGFATSQAEDNNCRKAIHLIYPQLILYNAVR